MEVQKQPFIVQIDPLSLLAVIKILSGNNVQSYNRDTNEYIDDRTLVPLLLMPYVSVVDPNEIMPAGDVKLTGIEWYLGVPETGSRIATNADYIISDTGCPMYSLKIKKNIDVNSPKEVYAMMYFTDTRTNKSVTVERSMPLRTTYYDSTNYSVKLNQPSGFTVDPTRTVEDANGDWPIKFSSQLFVGKDAAKDENSAYWYYILENGAYRLIDPATDLFMITKLVNGRFPKDILVNAMFIDNASFKVRAAYYTGSTPPAAPTIDSIQATTTMNVCLPKTASAKMITHKGMYIAPGVNQEIQCEVIIEDNAGLIANPEKYYFALWYAKARTAGSIAKQIGHGMILNTTSGEIGITNALGYDIYPVVSEKGPYKALDAPDGTHFTDNNNEVIVARTIKK